LDNGHGPQPVPTRFGPQVTVKALDDCDYRSCELLASLQRLAITGKPFIFAAGADLSALPFVSDQESSIWPSENLGHDVFQAV
jgi:hypothetical protein